MSSKCRVSHVVLLATVCLAVQPSAPKPVKAPLRDLPWSNQINFLHTTDTHGWHAGHLQEPSYSADWGDYVSFSQHLRTRADDDGSDLLLVDTGDKVEGNGLYDSSQPKGNYTYPIFNKQDVDIIVCGNHELYKQNTSEAEYRHVVPHYKENYIASNIDILDPKSGDRVPLAKRFRKFKTKNQDIQIMAFGFIFDFKGSSDHAFVQPVEETVKEKWFQDAIRDRSIDLFVIAGHSEIRSQEFALLFDQIREQQWDVPIMFFGGHFHIRDYKKYDDKAFGLASGRYMETVGFQSISGLAVGEKDHSFQALAKPVFARRYIDNNVHSYYHHSGTDEKTFPTELGKNVSDAITAARHALGLDKRFGCAPRDLWTNRAPFPDGEGSENSIYAWLQKDVMPEMVYEKDRADKSRIILANTGTMRFDVFKGAFTRDTTFIIQPFTNGFRYIPDVEFEKADKLLTILNNAGNIIEMNAEGNLHTGLSLLSPEQRAARVVAFPQQRKAHLKVSHVNRRAFRNKLHAENLQHPLAQVQFLEHLQKTGNSGDHTEPALTPGYTTIDDAGDDGDDTEHSELEFFRVPNVFESRVDIKEKATGHVAASNTVDVVFLDFVQPWILAGLKFLGTEYSVNDTKSYADHMDFTTMISEWVTRHWNGTDC